MKPGADVQKKIDEVGDALARALGNAVVCVAVYGSAAGEEFSPGLSDVNLLVVLREVTAADLRLIGATLRREAGPSLVFATPLVITPSFLRDARDSFPIELADIAARHRILSGEDVLADVHIAPERLRSQAEREARTLLLRLRSILMYEPGPEEVRRVLSAVASTVALIERALLRSASAGSDLPKGAALFAEVERRQGLRLVMLGRILALREGTERWPEDARLGDLLTQALSEVEALTAYIDSHAS